MPQSLEPSEAYLKQLAERRKRAAPSQKPQNGPVKPKRQGYGRFEVLNNFVDEWFTQFSPAECKVWMYLYRRTDGKTGECHVTLREIAKATGVANSTASAAIKRLEKAGLLFYIWRSPFMSKATRGNRKPSQIRLVPKQQSAPIDDKKRTDSQQEAHRSASHY
tara:strand:- start:24 stop:512 length:489 start_codon:yes stop_codon:yes gene_type:complete